jgi:hypothetical protein
MPFRSFGLQSYNVSVSVDWFNILGAEAITALNTLVNNGPDYGFTTSASMFGGGLSPNQYYQAPQERVSPSTIRLGFAVYF